jgi:hypothetical protein
VCPRASADALQQRKISNPYHKLNNSSVIQPILIALLQLQISQCMGENIQQLAAVRHLPFCLYYCIYQCESMKYFGHRIKIKILKDYNDIFFKFSLTYVQLRDNVK